MKIIRARYSRLIPYILGQWRRLLLIVILTLGTAVTTALQPWPMKILVDYALGHSALPPQLRWLTGLVDPSAIVLTILAALASMAFFAISSLLDAGLTWMWSVTGQSLIFGLTADLFHRLQRLSLLFHRRRTVGDSLERLGTDTWCIYSLTDALLTPF